MHINLKYKFFAIFFAFLFAMYFLLPSYKYFSLNNYEVTEVRKNQNKFNEYVPSWYHSSHIVPGLDLQGGIHIVLGLNYSNLIYNKLNRMSEIIKIYLNKKKKKIENLNINGHIINMKFKNSKVNQDFKKIAFKFKDLNIFSIKEKEVNLKLNAKSMLLIKKKTINRTIEILRKRINKMGVNEPYITKSGNNNIEIQLPGLGNINDAKKTIGRTAQLKFLLVDDKTDFLLKLRNIPNGINLIKSIYLKPNNKKGRDVYLQFKKSMFKNIRLYLQGKIPKKNAIAYGIKLKNKNETIYRTYVLYKKIFLTGSDLLDSYVSYNQNSNTPYSVIVKFNKVSGKIFKELTKKNIGNRLAILFENHVDNAPIIESEIVDGIASISIKRNKVGSEESTEANNLVLILKSGSLPVEVNFIEEKIVGPSLGVDAIKDGKLAFLVGFLLVALFMIAYYKTAGFFSIIGVMFNILFILSIFSYLGITLTLPGIAGLLLTISMSVDANIIINERIKEKIKKGCVLKDAVKNGYTSAFTSILDANVTTFIAGSVLWLYGSGPIQNFSVMLIVGTIFSVITSVFITRVFFNIALFCNVRNLL